MRKPFWKKSAKAWYVQIDGRQIRLGKEKEEAFREYHTLMADPSLVTVGPKLTVESLLDQFLFWTKSRRAKRTFDWYLDHLQSFASFVGPKLRVTACKPFHVTNWLAKAYPNSGDTHLNGALPCGQSGL